MNSEKNSSPKNNSKSLIIKYHDNLAQPGLVDMMENVVYDDHFDWHKPIGGFSSVKKTYPFGKVMDHDSRVVDSPQLVHSILIDNDQKSVHFYLMMELVKDITSNLWKNDDVRIQVARAKFNLLVQQHMPDGIWYNPPHVDPYLDKLSKVDVEEGMGQVNMLYYINSSDGDTFFFDGNHVTDYGDYSTRVSPKKGRVVFFEPDQYHASSPPINNQYRMVLNVNLLTSAPLPELYKYIEEEDKP